MRLTALSVCGTLLAFASSFWITADSDEGILLGDKGFGPCAASLRPEGPCRQGQHDSTCPYLVSLPPLTVHLPQQLRELEKIMRDLQKLKESVDELREMCADCTVSQTGRECGRQREHEKLNEGTDRREGERMNWMNEKLQEHDRDFRQGCGTDSVKVEKTEGVGDLEKRLNVEENERKKWEIERRGDKGVIKQKGKKESPIEEAEKGEKSQTDGAKGKDKLGQTKVPTVGGNERTVDMVREKTAEENNSKVETDRNKQNARERENPNAFQEDKMSGKERKTATGVKSKGKTGESDHHERRDETTETAKKTQSEAGDRIKMSGDDDEHTNEEQGEERKKEMEKGIKVERNNEEPKQTESIGRTEKEKTIKEGEVEEEGREKGKEIKTEGGKTESVQRDSDGELSSRKAIERTDFVSISPTPLSAINTASRPDSTDSNTATIVTSSLPSPPLPSSTLDLITDVIHETIAAYGPTQSTGLGAAVISEHPHPDAESDTTTATVGGPGRQRTSTTARSDSASKVRPGSGFQGHISSTMTITPTTTPNQNLYITAFPGATDHSRWAAKKNISSNTKAGVKPLPGRGPKPGEKHKPGIKPEADQKQKNPRNDRKPDRAPIPDKKTKQDQKQKPSHHKPTTEQSKPANVPKRVQISKPDQKTPPDVLPTDQNLKNNPIPEQNHDHTPDQTKRPPQKSTSHQKSVIPVQRPTSHQRPQTVNTTRPDKHPRINKEHDPDEIPVINQNSKPDQKPFHPPKTDKSDQKQKQDKKVKSEEKTKPDQRFELNQHPRPVQEPESKRSETVSFTPKPDKTPPSGNGREIPDENPSLEPKSNQDSAPRQKIPPNRDNTPPDQKPKPSQKIPKINQKPKPGQAPKPNQKNPKPVPGLKNKPNVNPKTGQAPQTNRNPKTPRPGQMPNVNPIFVPDEAESNKTSQPRPPPRNRPSTRPTVEPGATQVQRPKAAVQLKPNPNTRTHLDPPRLSWTSSDNIQNSQTGMAPTSGPVRQIAKVTHSPWDTEFSPSRRKTITLGPKTSNSLETGPSPHHHTLPEASTLSPNSRITSDLRPQTASQPPSIPMTTRPNKIISEILPSVIPSTGPGSTKPNLILKSDSSSRATILHSVDKTAPPLPDSSPRSQTTSTHMPDFRSTTPATSGPEPPAVESSTPSARELRVKINQVAAFLNNSLSPNGRPQDRQSKQHPEDTREDSRPDRTDNKLMTSKVSTVRRDCSDHRLSGETHSGVYLVTPDPRSRGFPVFCDMELDGGGWTVLQRRQDGSVSFNRTWAEYQSGFGELNGGEFWLGNNMIHLLTRDRDTVLRVELQDFDGVTGHAQYEQFRVASERLRYRLTVGGYSGTAGDALRFSKRYDHSSRAFTTPDRDHDRYPSGNCGAYYSSGWWFDACMAANLNGRYYEGRYKGVRDGIYWGTWPNISTEYYPTNERRSFKTVRMMIRPKGFAP